MGAAVGPLPWELPYAQLVGAAVGVGRTTANPHEPRPCRMRRQEPNNIYTSTMPCTSSSEVEHRPMREYEDTLRAEGVEDANKVDVVGTPLQTCGRSTCLPSCRKAGRKR